jgi:hypothetical protein
MGFLNFLKKDKQPIDLPPPPVLDTPLAPPPMDFSQPISAPLPAPEPVPEPIPEPVAPKEPEKTEPKMLELGPLKQEPMNWTSFQDSPPAPKSEAKPEKAPEPKVEPKPAPIDLPDFTDEEIESLDAPAPEIIAPVIPKTSTALPELPNLPVTISMPTMPALQEPLNGDGKFLSSESYLAVAGQVRNIRKDIRHNDETIKDALVLHEQIDQQIKRVAADTNSVQELLMKIEGSLFEG